MKITEESTGLEILLAQDGASPEDVATFAAGVLTQTKDILSYDDIKGFARSLRRIDNPAALVVFAERSYSNLSPEEKTAVKIEIERRLQRSMQKDILQKILDKINLEDGAADSSENPLDEILNALPEDTFTQPVNFQFYGASLEKDIEGKEKEITEEQGVLAAATGMFNVIERRDITKRIQKLEEKKDELVLKYGTMQTEKNELLEYMSQFDVVLDGLSEEEAAQTLLRNPQLVHTLEGNGGVKGHQMQNIVYKGESHKGEKGFKKSILSDIRGTSQYQENVRGENNFFPFVMSGKNIDQDILNMGITCSKQDKLGRGGFIASVIKVPNTFTNTIDYLKQHPEVLLNIFRKHFADQQLMDRELETNDFLEIKKQNS